MSDQVLWYLSRITGLMAWLAATGSVIAGLLGSSRRYDGSTVALWIRDAYRFLGLASLVFLVGHVVTSLIRSATGIGFVAGLIGWEGGSWAGTGLLAGVVAAWALVAIEGLKWLDRVPARRRTVAIAALGLVVAAAGAIHAIDLGTDTQQPGVQMMGILVLALVTLAVIIALGAPGPRPSIDADDVEPGFGDYLGPDLALPPGVDAEPVAVTDHTSRAERRGPRRARSTTLVADEDEGIDWTQEAPVGLESGPAAPDYPPPVSRSERQPPPLEPDSRPSEPPPPPSHRSGSTDRR